MSFAGGADRARPEPWRGPSEVGEPQPSVPPPLPAPSQPGQGLPEIVPWEGADLPALGGARTGAPARRERSEPLVALMGDIVRTGRWQAARRTSTVQIMGDVKLDLREVIAPGETLEVESWSLMGDVRIAVPPGTDVVITGGTLLGDVKTESDLREQPAPRTGARLVVRGYALMGDVIVREMGPDAGRPPRGWRWVSPRR